MSKSGSNYKAAHCAPEGRLYGAESWSDTGLFYFMFIFVLHFFFNNNSKDPSKSFSFLFLCHPGGNKIYTFWVTLHGLFLYILGPQEPRNAVKK